jgi:flagellar basal body-associated protein FliL
MMADPNQDQDDLVSQDDIDKLLAASSIEEAEESLETVDISSESDDMGELSQDDIDRLLNSGPEDTPDDARGDTDDDFGELSQNDIDNLMGGNPGNPADDDPEDEEEIELIDQSDIDRLMARGGDQEDPLESAAPLDTPESGNAQGPPVRDDFVISPEQAADPADCLITQDTLDTLIQNAPETDLDAVPLNETAPETNQTDVTQEDIDALLQDPDEETEEAEETVTAEEEEKEEEKNDVVDLEDEDDLLISQDDIDTLLMNDDQEDEDILEDVLGKDFEDMLDDESADEYSRDNDGDQDGPGSDQVVLEPSDATETTGIADKPSDTGRKWYRSKLLLAAASVLLVLAITVPAAYFLFFPRTPELPSVNQPIPRAAQEMDTDSVLDENPAAGNMLENSIQVDVAPVQPVARPGNMVLKNFIVLASDRATDMAYVTLDISIDYSDGRAYDEINSNLAFFRDLIYRSIQQNLVWEKRNEVTQNELMRGVEAGLQKALPPGFIKNVGFLSFKTS